jgi:hypothetical protein
LGNKIVAKKFAGPSEGAVEGRGEGGGIPPHQSDKVSEVGVRIFPEIRSDFVQGAEPTKNRQKRGFLVELNNINNQ